MALTNIYILKLEGGNYYVGKTDNPTKRYQEHVEGKGSAWTKKWPPINIDTIIANAGPFDEDKYTKQMMQKHGIDKVRGGSYVRVELDPAQITTLTKELRSAADQCSECGQTGHFVKSCPLMAEKRMNYELKEKCSVGRAPVETIQGCSTCGRKGHLASNCYAKTDKDGNDLDSEEEEWECGNCDRLFDTKFGCLVHMKSCSSKSKSKTKTKKDTCYRCGRPGHYSPDCYAKRHVNGEMLSDSEEETDSD